MNALVQILESVMFPCPYYACRCLLHTSILLAWSVWYWLGSVFHDCPGCWYYLFHCGFDQFVEYVVL